ncbi:MAG: hypothetical protein AAGF98_13625 [Cyanobacteria bacterium P01_H01_bin.153]
MQRILHRSLGLASIMIGIATLTASAHEVQIAGDVGATLHIEPNDIARAGADTDLWFALTQAGGSVIPLAACDCVLTIYNSADTVVSTPSLTPVSAEGFNDIPGATVMFPEVGAYDLVLTGKPQGAGQFSPFELSYEITVASQAPDATSAAAEGTPDTPAEAAGTADIAAEPAADNAAPPPNGVADTPTESPDLAQSLETPGAEPTSNVWRPALLVGGAIVVVGLIVAVMGIRRPPGDKA